MEMLYLHAEVQDQSALELPMSLEHHWTSPRDLERVVDICSSGRVQGNLGCSVKAALGAGLASGYNFKLL